MIGEGAAGTRGRMRVGVDARSLLCREPRGEGKSLLRLYKEILGQRPDIEVTLFGDEKAAEYRGALPERAKVVGLTGPTGRFGIWEELYFPWAARLQGCTVLHCTSSGGPRWSPLPILLTVHDLIPLTFDDGHDARARQQFARRLRNGLRRATRVATVSAHTRSDLEAAFPGAGAKAAVIHWGCDLQRYDVSRAGPNTDAPYLLAFGGEARRKNTEYTLERFIGVAQRLPALRFVLAGVNSTRQREELARRAREAGVDDRVEMPGYVLESGLAHLMRGATALLYLSLYEGFGVPVTEAIGLGVPVIASDCTSIPEILGDAPGCHALDRPELIEQAIVALVSDSQLCVEWAQAQAQRCRSLTWQACALRTIEQIELVASA
jgi:glycosyltransferase involved in cell wall biosynthesis